MAKHHTKDRESAARARVYAARQALHERQLRRRTRDDLVGGIVGGAVILVTLGLQTLFFVTGPGSTAAVPEPSGTPAVTDVVPGPITSPTP